MGQRLNISITDGEKVLANSYYHWSAYTSSSILLTERIIDMFYESANTNSAEVSVPFAVRLLNSIGAGLPDREEVYILQYDPKPYIGIPTIPCNNRNVGLIGVTPDGIADTERWEEGRVDINIKDQIVTFRVYGNYSKEDIDEYFEIEFNDLPEGHVDFDNIPFEDFYAFSQFYEENQDGYYDPQYGCAIMWVQ